MPPRLVWLGIGLWIIQARLGAETFTVNRELQVQFLGATQGTNHVMPGQRLRQLHGRAPAWLRDVLARLSPGSAAPVISRTSEDATLILWFWDASPSNRGGLRSPFVPQLVVMRPLADDGLPWGLEVYPQRAGWPWLFDAPIYPRRPRTILFEFASAGRGASDPSSHVRHAGTLRVRNPSPFDGPFWTPQPFPVRRSIHGMNLSVDDVHVERSIRTNAGRRWMHTRIVAELAGDFRDPDVRQRIRRVTLSDPTGNRIALARFPSSDAQTDGGSVRYWSSATLFDDDPAWQLSVELSPRPEEERSEVLQFAGVPDSSPLRTPPWDESGLLPVSSPVPAPPSQQLSRRIPGLGVGDVRVWYRDSPSDSPWGEPVQVTMTLTGVHSNSTVRVVSIEDREGRTWKPLTHQDPLHFGQIGRQSSWELFPSQLQTNATAPFDVFVEVMLTHRVDFLVPARIPRHVPDGVRNRIRSSELQAD
ncbi:MAG: hypothetical protein KF791_11340 [Verrucomicrobiae bacterium]|nr:hypothetical protein [Verrucomicrobiae bacterium]